MERETEGDIQIGKVSIDICILARDGQIGALCRAGHNEHTVIVISSVR